MFIFGSQILPLAITIGTIKLIEITSDTKQHQ